MPYIYLYHCSECSLDVEVVIAREFTVVDAGQRQDYHYPEPGVQEWPIRRVWGLWSRLWCPACRATRPVILVELEEPAEHPVQAFLEAERRGLTGEEAGPCPECGTELTLEVEGAPCPRCPNGVLDLLGEYEP